MSQMGLGRVKTPTFNLRVEIPSRFRRFENQKCLRPLLREDDRENNSAHSWLVHVFTQPGSKAALTAPKSDFRFTPESGLRSDIAPCPKSAANGLMHCNIQDRYSITSSAVATSEGGIVRPSAFALLRLTISSNLVGCSTGRSPGFAPFLLGRGPLRYPGKQTVPESVRTSR